MRRVSESALFSRRDHPEVRPVAAGARVGSAVSCVAFPDVCVPPSACDNPPDEEHSRVPPLAITRRLCEHPRTGFCASAVFTPPETCPGEQRRGSPAAGRGGGGASGTLDPPPQLGACPAFVHEQELKHPGRETVTEAERGSRPMSAGRRAARGLDVCTGLHPAPQGFLI